MLDSATKFELTPDMQEELKQLMQKVRCGRAFVRSCETPADGNFDGHTEEAR